MKVLVKRVIGTDDAISALYFSLWHWTFEMDDHIRDVVAEIENPNIPHAVEKKEEYDRWISYLLKHGVKEITLLKMVDMTVVVQGMGRASQDDWDSHAKRFDNRIIRSSTRTNEYIDGMASYYRDKVLTMTEVLEFLGIDIPSEVTKDGKTYVRGINGFIEENEHNNPDVKRGLYHCGFPSNFIFKVNLAEFAHVYKLRNRYTHAHPEVKECAEAILQQLHERLPWITEELLMAIEN